MNNPEDTEQHDRLAGIVRTALRERYPLPVDVNLVVGPDPRPGTSHRGVLSLLAVAATVLLVAGTAIGYAVANHGRSHAGPTSTNAAEADIIGITWKPSIGAGSAVFTRHTVSLDTECNHSLHQLVIGPHTLTIGKEIGVELLCHNPPPGHAESHFDRVMRGRVGWTVSDDTMRITTSSGESIVLHDRGRAATLTGERWVLVHVISSEGKETTRGNATAILMIDHGRVHARDLCGAITGTATATGTTITFRNMNFLPDCTNPTLPPENETIDSMFAAGRVQYQVNGNSLLLNSDAGQLIYKAVH
jgi:heat shock protein HslJ